MSRVYNFSPGPAVLPESVLKQAASELLDYRGTGMSVMEMSHRGKEYQTIFKEVKADLKRVMNVPDTHEILFMHGGATLQFAAAPMNLMGENGCADYVVTGNFAATAAKEAVKYGSVNIAASSEDRQHTYIPGQDEIKQSPDASYLYYCSNNTVYGTEWCYVPQSDKPIVCDMSSNILSKPVDVSKFGLIFAGVQKNLAPAGLAVVIIDRSLAGRELPFTPKIMSYAGTIKADSMENTPPCYTIYMLGLMLKWLDDQGGAAGIEQRNIEKAGVLYSYLDESRLFTPLADRDARSNMNVTFRSRDADTDAAFIKEAASNGFVSLAGYRTVGGMRVSLYNAMPEEGVCELVKFMKKFEVRHV